MTTQNRDAIILILLILIPYIPIWFFDWVFPAYVNLFNENVQAFTVLASLFSICSYLFIYCPYSIHIENKKARIKYQKEEAKGMEQIELSLWIDLKKKLDTIFEMRRTGRMN